MERFHKLIVAATLALPLLAAAQSSPNIKPADAPRTQLEKEQTTENGQATKYGGPGTDTSSDSSKTSKTDRKSKMTGKSGGSNATGDVPTYPAPKADGTQTSPQTTK